MRWTVFAMLARAFLPALTATQPPGRDVHRDQNGHDMIPLTRDEIRRLFTGLTHRPGQSAASSTGPAGDDATRPPPENAAASAGNRSPSPDHQVTLEY